MAVSTNTDLEDGPVADVVLDEKITDPESELAVQVPPEADASNYDALAVHKQPSPEEVFAAAAGSDTYTTVDQDGEEQETKVSDAAKDEAKRNADREQSNKDAREREKAEDAKRAEASKSDDSK